MVALTLENVRAEEWSRGWLWELDFPDYTAKGKGFWPAVDVEEGVWSLTSQEWQMSTITIKAPNSAPSTDLRVTFIEYADHRIAKWLRGWYEEIHLADGTIQYLVKAARLVNISRLNLDRSVLYTNQYWVYPEGEASFHGASESAPEMTTQAFTIVGRERADKK